MPTPIREDTDMGMVITGTTVTTGTAIMIMVTAATTRAAAITAITAIANAGER